jgi:hypothetical protein
MEVLDPASLMAGSKRVEIGCAAHSEIMGALESIRRVRARIDAGEVALARRLRGGERRALDAVSKAINV